MSKRILVLSLASLFFYACKSNKDTASTADSTATSQVKTEPVKTEPANSEPVLGTAPTEPVTSDATAKLDSSKGDLYRLSVVFFSIGSGTDNKAMTAYEDFISEYAVKAGKNIDFERTPWGREGETDYCLRLNELDAKSQADFVQQTKEKLKDAKWVHIYENEPCRHKRKR
jgi:hypothetical protein